jgi:hypothetical protein
VSLLGRLFERRDLTSFGPYSASLGTYAYDPSRIPSNAATYGNVTGEVVTEDSALRLSTVWACVRLLADAIASLPWGGVHAGRGGQGPLGSAAVAAAGAV